MRIGELAQATHVSRDALRFYEERGLIGSRRSANGYRDYPEAMVQLVQFIKTAQRLGFTLGEISENVDSVQAAQGQDQDRVVLQLLQEKVLLIDERINELDALRKELRERIGQACPLALNAD